MYIRNTKGLREYHILEKWEAGIKLLGSEVKSIRAGRVDLNQSFVRILNGEAVLINLNIPAYLNAPIKNYDPQRSRKLLLNKKEILTLIGKTSGRGLALIPMALYDKHNLIKVEVGLGKSKKIFDHKKTIKERDNIRRDEQELRGKV